MSSVSVQSGALDTICADVQRCLYGTGSAYPTGAIGLLRPLVQAGLIPGHYPISIHAVFGADGLS